MTFTFEPQDIKNNKINAIKLMRDFTYFAFGTRAHFHESKDLVNHIAKVAAENEIQNKIRDSVAVLLQALPIDRRRAFLTNLAATTFNGIPNFNPWDIFYNTWL